MSTLVSFGHAWVGCALVHERGDIEAGVVRDAGDRMDVDAEGVRDARDSSQPMDRGPGSDGAATFAGQLIAERGCREVSAGELQSSWLFTLADPAASCDADTSLLDGQLRVWVFGDPPSVGRRYRIRGLTSDGFADGMGLSFSGTLTIESFTVLGEAILSWDLVSTNGSMRSVLSHAHVTRWCSLAGCTLSVCSVGREPTQRRGQ